MVSRELSSAAQLSSAFSEELPAQLSSAQQVFFQLSSLSSGKSLGQLSSAQLSYFFQNLQLWLTIDYCVKLWLFEHAEFSYF